MSHFTIIYCPCVCRRAIWRSSLPGLIVLSLDGERRKIRTVSVLMLLLEGMVWEKSWHFKTFSACEKNFSRKLPFVSFTLTGIQFPFKFLHPPKSPLPLDSLAKNLAFYSVERSPQNVHEQTPDVWMFLFGCAVMGREGKILFSASRQINFRKGDNIPKHTRESTHIHTVGHVWEMPRA